MTEMLFECYGVPSVCYGVDALFAYLFNRGRMVDEGKNGILIHSGFVTTHILPIMGEKFNPASAVRIDVGGFHGTDLLQNLLVLKYPRHR